MSIFAEMPGRRAVTLADLPEMTGEIDPVAGALTRHGLIHVGPELHYKLDEHRTRLRWHWRILDHAENPYRHVASGASLRWKRAAKRLQKAYCAEKDRIERLNIAHAEALAEDADRAKARERRDGGPVSES